MKYKLLYIKEVNYDHIKMLETEVKDNKRGVGNWIFNDSYVGRVVFAKPRKCPFTFTKNSTEEIYF